MEIDFLGMMDLGNELSDPFGDDDVDFPLSQWPGIARKYFLVFVFDAALKIVFCMNRVHMAATGVKVAEICTETWTASNGISPGVKNPKHPTETKTN